MAYTWWVYLHVAGALVFVAAHGVSMGVALRLRGERDPRRIMALLDVSSTSISGLYVGLLLLLTIVGAMAEGSEAVSDQRLAELLAGPRAMLLTVVGLLGLLFILYLMFFKPF